MEKFKENNIIKIQNNLFRIKIIILITKIKKEFILLKNQVK